MCIDSLFVVIFFLLDENLNKMADHQENTSHQQCQDDNHDEPQQVYSIVENHDCLEHIFMHLDATTLLNSVAHSSKLFQTLAVSVFKRKFGKKTIALRWDACIDFGLRTEDSINVSQLKLVFPFLRVFGAEISKLQVHYYSLLYRHSKLGKSKRWSIDSMMRRIDEYINKYCADTLVSIDMRHKEKFSYDFPKPFKQIEQVRIQYTRLYDNLLDFVDWFPNLQHFEINAECIDCRFSNVTFPHLKNLKIVFGDVMIDLNMNDDEKILQMKHAGELLKANQELHGVEVILHNFLLVGVVMTFNKLLDIVSDNPRLLKIVFGVNVNALVCVGSIGTAQLNRIVKEHPGLVELEINNDNRIEVDDAISMVRKLNSLEKFRFNINEFEYKQFIDQLASDWEYTSKLSNGPLKHYSIDLHRK